MTTREDWDRMAIILSTCDDEDEEIEVTIKATPEVCSRCDGRGKHDHPAFSNGISSEDWAEWGEDDREAYRAGAYDVTCSECKGRRVVLVEDETDPNYALLAKWREQEYAYHRECEAERRMGC